MVRVVGGKGKLPWHWLSSDDEGVSYGDNQLHTLRANRA